MNTKSYVLGHPPPPGREGSTLPWHQDPCNYAQILARNKTHRSGTVPHFSLSLITHTDTHSGKEILLAPATHQLSTSIGCLYSPTCCLAATQCYLLGSKPKSKKLLHFEAFWSAKAQWKMHSCCRLLSNLRDQPQTCQDIVSSSQGMAAGRGYDTWFTMFVGPEWFPRYLFSQSLRISLCMLTRGMGKGCHTHARHAPGLKLPARYNHRPLW
jgi:hypothetical protein